MTSISPAAISRLRRDFAHLKKSSPQYITAVPLESNLLEWHYVIYGPPSTPYANGIYWGKLNFPVDYPYKPPEIRMFTPSGRFMPNVRICMSNTSFHAENWNPSWTVSTILMGLVSFMCENTNTYGAIQSTESEKKMYAQKSWKWNCTQQKFSQLFPSIIEEYEQKTDEDLNQQELPESAIEPKKNQSSLSLQSNTAIQNNNKNDDIDIAAALHQPFLRRRVDTIRNNHDRPETLVIGIVLVLVCVLMSYWIP
jgi:ubiquitin-conjugating enzyme E2 J2